MQYVDQLKALSSERRLQILEWLKDPVRHFPAQVDGDLVKDGVCALFLADKLRIKQWTFYRRDDERIEALKAGLVRDL